MICTVSTALLSTDVDERQMAVLLGAPCAGTALAAFGAVIAQVVGVISRDRRMVRTWLSAPRKAAV